MPNKQISEVVLLEFFGVKGAKLPPGAERFVREHRSQLYKENNEGSFSDGGLSDPWLEFEIGDGDGFRLGWHEDKRWWPGNTFEGFALIMRGLWRDERDGIDQQDALAAEIVGDALKRAIIQVKIWTKIIRAAQAERGKGEG
jgi:hypothetical protein